MAKVVVAGGTGLIGSAICKSLDSDGFEVVVLTRKERDLPHARTVFWDGESHGNWRFEIDGAHAVVNLSGYPIINRWTPKNIAKIEASRIGTTELIGESIEIAESPPEVWINASAVGYYGDSGDREVTEATRQGEGYLGELCKRWEDACLLSNTPCTRKVCLRFGVVLAPEGEFVKKTVLQTRLFLGSAIGTGRQYMSWIHIDDLVRLVRWCLAEPVNGPLNGTSPNPVTNSEAMAVFREILCRPPVPNVPILIIKAVSAIIGIEPRVILSSTRAVPEIVCANGFKFEFEEFGHAVNSMVKDAPEAWNGA